MSRILASWACVLVLFGGSIRTIDGALWRPLEPHGAANVLFFVATDCPISNGYAPEIQRICSAYAARGVQCALIYEDAGVGAREVRAHLEQHRYHAITAAIDADGSLAARVNA